MRLAKLFDRYLRDLCEGAFPWYRDHCCTCWRWHCSIYHRDSKRNDTKAARLQTGKWFKKYQFSLPVELVTNYRIGVWTRFPLKFDYYPTETTKWGFYPSWILDSTCMTTESKQVYANWRFWGPFRGKTAWAYIHALELATMRSIPLLQK